MKPSFSYIHAEWKCTDCGQEMVNQIPFQEVHWKFKKTKTPGPDFMVLWKDMEGAYVTRCGVCDKHHYLELFKERVED